MDVGQNTARRDGYSSKKLVQLLVVTDGELDVAGNDASLLVVASGVAGELENLSGQVLENRTEVHRGACADARGILALLEVAMNATDRELKPCLLGA